MSITATNQLLQDHKCCIIIPTYNNAKTLNRVLNGVLKYTNNIIIVNDGATDETSKILEAYSQLEIITISPNQGKGNALRVGFKKAIVLGFKNAITIDSDGQHFPEDIAQFIECLDQSSTKNLLLIGSRNMSQEGVPKKSSFGNKFSNFWFWFETGIKLQDTQSGFRLYPLQPISEMKFITKKFEFEIEVIVKAAWRGVTVENIPVQVLYDESERVSHFRPFKDFTRISILNTVFVIITLFYIKPRDFIRNFKKKGVKKFLAEDLLGIDDSPVKKALSVALGVFVGISPLWGLHTILVVFLAVALKLNKVIAFTFSNVSLPPFIPFILYASLKLGSWLLGSEFNFSVDTINENFEFIKHLKTYVVGSFTLAITAATLLGFLSFIIFSFFGNKKAIANG
ncbi:DUF2062 domain-containing protein [Patiriisocius marinus]|uniref:Glycosyl transferase n=1 Tax=Patiriisocius marinus TaxID=1397112 RepID=A0A5J4J1E8_9FLAO|nr:DUF2062 domain-containing protein [Patiriisocius marinus]GER58317.1 glycosyl transferase [Patiriisocius marinus]